MSLLQSTSGLSASRYDLSAFAQDLLLSDTCRQRGIFNEGYVKRLFSLNTRGRDLDLQLWTMLSFELWCRRFLDASSLTASAPLPSRQSRRQSPAIIAAAAVGTGTNG